MTSRAWLWVVTLQTLSAPGVLAQRTTLGVVVGGVHSTIVNEPSEFGRRWGGTVGVQATRETSAWLASTLELAATQRGATGVGPWRMRMTYAELAVLERISWPRSRRGISPMAAVGVALTREVACGGRTYDPLVDPLPGTTPSVVRLDCAGMRSRKTDAAVTGGLGLVGRGASAEWSLEVRSVRGVRDLNGYGPDSPTLKNRAIEVRLGAGWRR